MKIWWHYTWITWIAFFKLTSPIFLGGWFGKIIRKESINPHKQPTCWWVNPSWLSPKKNHQSKSKPLTSAFPKCQTALESHRWLLWGKWSSESSDLASGTSPESLGEFMKNHEFLRILMVINQIFTRPGKRLHNELEHHHAINGQIHLFLWPFSMSQTVSLPEGIRKIMGSSDL